MLKKSDNLKIIIGEKIFCFSLFFQEKCERENEIRQIRAAQIAQRAEMAARGVEREKSHWEGKYKEWQEQTRQEAEVKGKKVQVRGCHNGEKNRKGGNTCFDEAKKQGKKVQARGSHTGFVFYRKLENIFDE